MTGSANTVQETVNSRKADLDNGSVPCKSVSYTNKKKSKGQKSYIFWTLVVVLCFLAWANLLLSVFIFRVLRLGHGLESMELLPEEAIVKFYGESFFGKLFISDVNIKGFSDLPIEIKSVKSSVIFEIEDSKGRVRNSLKMDQNGSYIRGVKDFTVGDIFSVESPNFRLPYNSHNLETKLLTTCGITSAVNEKLIVKSDYSSVKLSGSEGTIIEGKEILWTADQEIHLKTINGNIILSGKDGIHINVKSIPVVENSEIGLPVATQYKVCVCMPEGKLFRVPISRDLNSHLACHSIDVSSKINPCM